ncbi:MAG TPA: hypothetical protein VFA41_04745 [Ktedonobacteraceae bacterium]|jgi:hypothetical protein|nr:hypothetical protein [Ktedonobacteraceae bacterium]
MDDGCAALIGILIVIAIAIALIVYVVLPLSIILLVGISSAGVVSGAAVAVKNFGELMVESHKTIK